MAYIFEKSLKPAEPLFQTQLVVLETWLHFLTVKAQKKTCSIISQERSESTSPKGFA